MKLGYSVLVTVLALVLASSPAAAQFDSGSDGSDGAFNPQSDIEIDLSLAATGQWDDPSPVEGQGVYDPDKWAVVFKYTTVTIPDFVDVTFKNHPSGAPVVWLAQGDVTFNVNCGVDVYGQDGRTDSQSPSFAHGGPGGFDGGRRGINDTNLVASGGFGPGGGWPMLTLESPHVGGGGSYGTHGADGGAPAGETYGNTSAFPLIGGSGGGSGSSANISDGSGAGGGAILIASSGEINLASTYNVIDADGGNASGNGAGGSGGAIRLIANTVRGAGISYARGGSGSPVGGAGRLRVEAYNINLERQGDPPWTSSAPGPVFPPSDTPVLKATMVDGVEVPSDPGGGILTPDLDMESMDAVTVMIEANYVPVGTTVTVRVVPARGDVVVAESTPLAGTLESSTATAQVVFPRGSSEVYLRANWTP